MASLLVPRISSNSSTSDLTCNHFIHRSQCKLFDLACSLRLSHPRTSLFISSPLAQANIKRYASATSGTDNKVSGVIIHDHKELKEYYDNILSATDNDTKTRWQNQFTWELARHSIAEELVVYPAMERSLGDRGKERAEKDRAEHQVVKEHLKILQNLKATDVDFEPTLKSLMADLSAHIDEEESDDLPSLEKALAADESADLAKSFQRTKMFIPTRSHPSAPARPPFETVAGLLAAPMDRLGDLFRKFPKET